MLKPWTAVRELALRRGEEAPVWRLASLVRVLPGPRAVRWSRRPVVSDGPGLVNYRGRLDAEEESGFPWYAQCRDDGRSGDCRRATGRWLPAVDRSPAGIGLGCCRRHAAQRHGRRRGRRLEGQGRLVERREWRVAQRLEVRGPGRDAVDNRHDAARWEDPVRHRRQPGHGAAVGRRPGRDDRRSDLVGDRQRMVHGGTDAPWVEGSAVHWWRRRADSPLGW